MPNNISTLGQQIGLISRVKQIQTQMSAYQQQVSTGVKYQNFKDYGADGLRIQGYRADLLDISSYSYNIEIAQNNIEQMDSAITETIEQTGNVLSAINIQLAKGSDFDLESIKNVAATALQLVQANMNVKIGDRYLLAGTDVSNQPYTGAATVTSNVQTRITDWLNGTTTTDGFLTSIDSMTDSQLGYSATLQSSKNVFARADDTFEVDYTVKANDEGFNKLVTAMNTLAELKFPVEGVDTPTKDQFYEVMDTMYKTLQEGITSLRGSASKIASAAQALEATAQNHLNDRQNLQRILESTEGADTTDAVVKFQTLQTQLDASYRVTSILSQLSLARFLSGG